MESVVTYLEQRLEKEYPLLVQWQTVFAACPNAHFYPKNALATKLLNHFGKLYSITVLHNDRTVSSDSPFSEDENDAWLLFVAE